MRGRGADVSFLGVLACEAGNLVRLWDGMFGEFSQEA
jgi:hypothetical protein